MINFFPKVFKGFFNKRKLLPVFQENPLDISCIDHSLELLNTSSKELIAVACKLNHSLQEELEETKFQLFSIMDSIEDFVLVKDGTGRWKRLNKFGQRLYNLNIDDYYNLTSEQVYARHPRLKEHLIDCLRSDETAWQAAAPTRSEEAFDGHIFDIIKTPLYEEGIRRELIIVGRDITELQEKRRRIKACFNALNAANDVIVITDYNNHIIFCNDRFLNKFGFHSFDEVLDRSLDIISVSSHPDFYQELCNRRSTNSWIGSTQNYKQDGTVLNCNLTVLPVMNGVPYPIYYIYIIKPA